MKTKRIITFFLLILMIFSVTIHINIKQNQIYVNDNPSFLKVNTFWTNISFIHITGLNWTDAGLSDWCSGSGSWDNPYLIENIIINASNSPIGCGILIENSTNVYFKIQNVTIYEGIDGIRLENTKKGTIFDNVLLNNMDSGIYLINSLNNTISRNILYNNGMNGLYLTTGCYYNKIIRKDCSLYYIYSGDACINLIKFKG